MDNIHTSHGGTWVSRATILLVALVLLAPLGTSGADARVGGGFSFGSRGSRTFSMPSATATAPRPAFPMQRSETPSFGNPQPSFAPRPQFGFGSGLAAGLLGAGLFGLLTGNGFFGGLAGIGSFFGLLLQIGLVVLLVRWALSAFRARSGRPAFAGPMARQAAGGLGGLGSGFGSSSPGRGTAPAAPIGPSDFASFERLLSDIQYAYGREDAQALSRLATPEMQRFLAADIAANRDRGLRNELSDVRLLQGDLSEAWREGTADYATVAMRFEARDVMVNRTSGRIVEGDPARPVQATELWTFRRESGGAWQLSAIQQTR